MDIDKFLNRVYRRPHGIHSLRFYRSGIRKLERFCFKVYGKKLEKAIVEMKEKALDVHDFLDRYASWIWPRFEREDIA